MNATSAHKRRSRKTSGRRLFERSSDLGPKAAELDRLVDARERLVHAIDELEAGRPGIDSARALLEAPLADLDDAVREAAS